jgi:hypothetical protein
MSEDQSKRKLELEDKENISHIMIVLPEPNPRKKLKTTRKIQWEGVYYDLLGRISPTKEEEFRQILQSRQQELATG